MRKIVLRAIAAATIILGLVPAAGARPADRAREMQRILASVYPADEPGASAIVVDDGEVVFRGASGMADLELDVPLEPGMVFRLGSITKQFTAAAILMLAEEGQLSVDDPITRFLPSYPTHGHEITVHHLLTHTSGIWSYTQTPDLERTGRLDVTTEELIDSFDHEAMDFAPGDRFSYNNSGYVLLGAIIETVSGMSYAEFIRTRIFEPLGMSRSYYGGTHLIEDRVSGYHWEDDAFVNAPYISMSVPHAAGSLLSTVDDMARWNAALFGGELISEASLELMTTEGVLNDGEATGYGYGLGISEFRGTDRVSHSGGINGFITSGLYLPDEGIYVAVLSNRLGTDASPRQVAARLAAVAMGNPLPEFERVEIDPESMERFSGIYRIDEATTCTVRREGDHLVTLRSDGGRSEAYPYSDTGFFYEDSFSYFEMRPTADGGLEMHLYADGDVEPEIALLTDEPLPASEGYPLDAATFERYVGRYELSPGFEIEITTDDGRYFSQATGQDRAEILARSETEFYPKDFDATLVFEVDASGNAIAVVLHQRSREMRGSRLPD